jgi:hypothetical protein
MEKEPSKEFFWKTYEKLPEDLKEAIFSENNNEAVKTICSRLNLTEDQTSLVAKYTGRTLMGLLPLKELPITLELELNIEESVANQIIKELTYAIFRHLRVSLNKIYSDNYFENIPLKEDLKIKEDAKIKKDAIIEKKEESIKYDGYDPYREVL